MKTRPIFLFIIALTMGMLMTLTIVGMALAASANLSINILDLTDPVTAGDSLEYNITVSNFGSDPAYNVVMTATLDAETSFVSITPSTNCSHSSGVVTCTMALLNSGSGKTYTLEVNVAPDARGTLVASTEVDSVVPDGVDGNNTHSVETTINTNVDLKLAHLTPQPNPAVAGDVLTYRLAITNNGKSLATGVVLTEKPPNGKTEEFIAGSPWANCTGNATEVNCNIGSVAPVGVTGSGWLTSGSVITIAVRPKADLTTADTLFNVVSAAGVEAESKPGDNFTFKSSGVVRQSDMTVEISAPTGPVQPETPISYTITVTNTGPSDNTGVVVTGTYKASDMVIEGAVGATCHTSSGQIVCQLGTIADTQVKTFTWQAKSLKADLSVGLQTEVRGNNVEPDIVGVNFASMSTQIGPFTFCLPIVINPSPEEPPLDDN